MNHSILTCSVLLPELNFLAETGFLYEAVERFDSALHMNPNLLEEELKSRISNTQTGLILICGDCSAGMYKLERLPDVVRIGARNCVEALLGHEKRRWLEKSGTFFLLPEWTKRWRKVLGSTFPMGDGEFAKVVVSTHKRMLYLDTGVVALPEAELEEIGNDTGLAVEVMPVTLDHLKELIEDARLRLEEKLHEEF